MGQISACMEAKEQNTIRKSFSGYAPLWFDTGKRDKEGNRIFRSLDTGQEQVFDGQEE